MRRFIHHMPIIQEGRAILFFIKETMIAEEQVCFYSSPKNKWAQEHQESFRDSTHVDHK